MRIANTAEFIAFWDAKVAAYLPTVPTAGGLRGRENARLAQERVTIAGLGTDQDLAPYEDAVTPVQIVGSTIQRSPRTRPLSPTLERVRTNGVDHGA